MKTLKKVLSLVLVVAMIASMCIVGAAATEETTNYPEAVAVVKGVGIIEGDETGMNFAGDLTREQAAKIIAYALLGKNVAESLSTSSAPFADVAANRWSAKYISYLKGQGIISGVSDTEFDPTANVTGIAFAKMLLVAIGYGQAGEFEGAAWDINTITFANQTGIYEGTLAATPADDATREEAMLYLFNALQVPTVKYNKTFEAYYTGTSPLQTEGINLEEYTLGYLNFDLTREDEGTDALGRPAAVWAVDGLPIVEATATVLPTATFSNKVTKAQLYAALGKTAALTLATGAGEGSSYYIDGVAQLADESPVPAFPALTEADAADIYSTAIGATGAITELYVEYLGEGEYDIDIVVYYEYYTTVKNVDAYSTVYLANANGDTGLSTVAAGFARKDAVMYTIDKDGAAGKQIVTLRKVEPVTGYLTASNSKNSTIVVDGKTYSYRAGVSVPTITNPATSYDLYLDCLGNVAKMIETEAAEVTSFNYLYVREVEADIQDKLTTSANKVAVEVVYPNGGVAVANLAVYDYFGSKYIMLGETPVFLKVDAAGNPDDSDAASIARVEGMIPNGWYTYTATDDGINLAGISAAANYAEVLDTIGITAGVAKVTGTNKIIDANTTLTVVDIYGTATVTTGALNIVSGTYGVADQGQVLVTFAKDSKVIKNITVVEAAPVAPLDLVYCLAAGDTVYNGVQYTVVYKDGTVGTAVVPNRLDVETGEYTVPGMTPGCVYNIQYVAAYAFYSATPVTEGVVNGGWLAVWEFWPTVYKPEATIATVAENYFTTVEYTQEDVDDGIWNEIETPNTYYYDAYTVIVDCTGNGATTLTEGDIFVAATINPEAGTFAGLTDYCTYIWIVG